VYDSLLYLLKILSTFINLPILCKMKGKIEHIEAEMSRLNEKMIAIKDLNSKIDSSLAENRLKVFRLSSVHVLLKKVLVTIQLYW
jgi:hypothetical protein